MAENISGVRRVMRRYPCLLTAALGALAWGCNGDSDSANPPLPTVTATRTNVPTATATIALPVPGEGLQSAVQGAVVASDPQGQVSVDFTLSDDHGAPLIPSLGATQDTTRARVRFTIAHVDTYSGGGENPNTFTRYINDIRHNRPAYDSNGVLSVLDARAGLYRYTFGTKLPADFDRSATYTIGMQVDRNVGSRSLGLNPVYDFVPGGGPPTIRAGATTEQCNSCHAPLVAHGSRREVRLCLTCHTHDAVDELGRSIDMGVMVHKIHRGKGLPSVANGAPGATYAIYSSFARADIVFAEKKADGSVAGVGFPRNISDCGVCHSDGETAAFHTQKPAAAICTSCHDDVNPSLADTAAGPPGTKHFGRGYPDGQCSACHIATMGQELDLSVPGAHVIAERSAQLQGLHVDLVGMRNHGAGQIPTLSFKITEDSGASLSREQVTSLNRLAFTFAGPTSDYSQVLTAVAAGGGAAGTLVGPNDEGIYEYTPTFGVPAAATGTWSVGTEARRPVQLTTGREGVTRTVNETAPNSVVTFSTDGSTAMVRRTVVEDQKCAACHGELSKDFSIHGGLRNQTEYCVLCHNATQSDAGRRRRDDAAVAAGAATETIDMKVMIHKIHRGEELSQQPYLLYGFGPAPQSYTAFDFGHVLYPGDLRECTACHAAGTYLLPPFPATALKTRQTVLDPGSGNEIEVDPLAPITAACSSCHDNDAARAHAQTQTTAGGAEACAVCHQEGREVAVSAAHAGRN